MYQCIACQGELVDKSLSLRICSDCGNSYPVINGVSVFLLPDTLSALHGFIMEMEDIKSSFAEINNSLEDFERCDAGAGMLVNRIGMTKEGMAGNIRVLEKSCQPITDFLQDWPCQNNALAWSTVKSGFTSHSMLPYFYQDWSGTSDFAEVRNLFSKTLAEYCKDRASIAVLGAGACGLLYSFANDFQISYGLDLSLPTLLTAKDFIEGEPLTFHLQKADWHKVELIPPEPIANDIRYVVSNVMNMPFKHASVSVVVTQYMLDIVSNQKRLAEEIYRVLKPDGLWINFSIPFRLPGDPVELYRRKLNELPVFFNEMGFDVVSLANERFTLLNLEKVCAETGNNQQLVHFFTLRKSARNLSGKNKSVQRFFKQNNSVWCEIPRIVKGRELTFIRTTSFGGQGCEGIEIRVAGDFFSIPSDFAMLLETIFACVNGKNSLRKLFAVLQDKGIRLSEETFLQLIYVLNVQHYLIELEE